MNSTVIENLVVPLGWTLLHFLWQGALVGLLHEMLLRFVRHGSPQLRYRISLAAFLLLATLPVATFIALAPGSDPVQATRTIAPVTSVGATAGTPDSVAADNQWLLIVVLAWAAGVFAFGLRFVFGLLAVRRLANNADFDAVPERLQAALRELGEHFRVPRHVRLALTTRVAGPLVAGWLRPVIYLPLTAVTGLDHQQLRMVLAHELAHLSRYDHFVNLFQIAVETLLFYHPVVHRVSRSIRREREQCCDDLAVAVVGSRVGYARLLAELEQMRQRGTSLTPALGMVEQELYVRVHRLVAQTPVPGRRDERLPLVLMLLAGFALLTRGIDVDAPLFPAFGPDGDASHRLVLDLPPATSRPFVPIRALAETQSTTDAAAKPAETASERPSRTRGTRTRALQAPSRAEERSVAAAEPAKVAPREIETPAVRAPAPTREVANAVEESPRLPARTGGELVHAEPPVYPRKALRAGTEGRVLIAFTISAEGLVTDPEIVSAEPRRLFEKAALDAIASWRYRPFLVGGEPASRRVTQEIEFRLSDAEETFDNRQAGRCFDQVGTRVCRRNDAYEADVRVIEP